MELRQSLNTRIALNFQLVWLDGSIEKGNNEEYHNSITKLRKFSNIVNTFIDADPFIDFITDIKEETAFMIVSGAFSNTILLPIVQDISQVSSVYILCEKKTQHENWTKEWTKLKGVYTDITPVCVALKQAAQEHDQNSVSVSFVQTVDGP